MKRNKNLAKTIIQKQLKEWSSKVKELAGFKCEICGSTRYLNSHHIIPKRFYPQHQLDINNGICLCSHCHQFSGRSAHKNGCFFSRWLETHRPDKWKWVCAVVEVDLYFYDKKTSDELHPCEKSLFLEDKKQ